MAADPALGGVGSDSSGACSVVAGVVGSRASAAVPLIVGCEAVLFAAGLLVGEGAADDAGSLDAHRIRCRQRVRSSSQLVPGLVLAMVLAGARRVLWQYCWMLAYRQGHAVHAAGRHCKRHWQRVQCRQHGCCNVP